MSKRSVVTFVFMVIAGAAAPLYAQEARAAGAASATEVAKWSIITAGFALAFAAGLAALAQGRAVGAAAEGDRAQSERGRRHPWLAAPRSRPDRVARHLRAADLADPVLRESVRRVAGSGGSGGSQGSGFTGSGCSSKVRLNPEPFEPLNPLNLLRTPLNPCEPLNPTRSPPSTPSCS